MLIICCTPLQTLVAHQMLRAEKAARFKLIYYTWVDNAKHRYYYDKLACRAGASAFVCFDARFPLHLLRFARALRTVGACHEDTIAFAAINNVYVQYTIRRFAYEKLLTFDDGTANISSQSVYFRPKRRSALHELGGLILHAGREQNWIRSRSLRHYTIYPGFENIVEPRRLVPISLFDAQASRLATRAAEHARTLRIFLGQPLDDAGDGQFSAWYRALLETLRVDEYLPHPRESGPYSARHVVRTPLIAEDYILSKLAEYGSIDIYAVASTALLNIDTNRTRKFVVIYPEAPPQLAALYPLFQSRGCTLATPEQLAVRGR